MEELYKFMNQSNATLDLKVGNELAADAAEGEALAEVRYGYIFCGTGLAGMVSTCQAQASPGIVPCVSDFAVQNGKPMHALQIAAHAPQLCVHCLQVLIATAQ